MSADHIRLAGGVACVDFARNRPVGADTVVGYRLWITRIAGDGEWAAPTPTHSRAAGTTTRASRP